LWVTPEPDESDSPVWSSYPGPDDPGRWAFFVAMLATALVIVGLIAVVIFTWPPRCYGTRCW
jgi:hypothetical protein